jgi:hypothetical protein
MVGVRDRRRTHETRLLAAAATLGLVVGCASDRATPTPSTPLPPLPQIVVTVTATSTTATPAPPVPTPATTVPLLTDVYGVPVDTGVVFTVPLPPPTTAPHPPPSATAAPPAENTAPPTTDCPRKKHRRRCKP